MSMQRRLISLVGTLVVLIALVAGTLLMALPVYIESRDIKNEEAQVAASNELLFAQINALRAKQAEMPQLEAELAELRNELPHIPRLEDAVKLTLRAVSEVDGSFTGVSFGEPTDFLPRADSDILPSLPASATEVAPGGQAPAQPPAAEDPTGDSDQGTGAGAQAPPPAPTGAAQLQVSVSLTVTVPSPIAAARLLDGLREGPRLLRIDTVTATSDSESGELSLLIDGVVFVQAK